MSTSTPSSSSDNSSAPSDNFDYFSPASWTSYLWNVTASAVGSAYSSVSTTSPSSSPSSSPPHSPRSPSFSSSPPPSSPSSATTSPFPPPPSPSIEDIENLPSYDTYNSLPPQFQVTSSHDPNHIFPEEEELVEQVRKLVGPAAERYPSRYILIFLFARRHSVPHSVKLLTKHLTWLHKMGFPEVTKEQPYPFKADQLTETEKHWAIVEGPVLYKHILIDKHNRLLQYIRLRCWVQGRISVQRYISSIVWWYYYAFQHVPLSIHRNGMSVVIDMRDMGWANVDFSGEIQDFISTALTCFPGRMRQAWIVNSNWIFNTAWSLVGLVLSTKVMSRMKQVPLETLLQEIDTKYLCKELGGVWEPNPMLEWYDKAFQLDALMQQEQQQQQQQQQQRQQEQEQQVQQEGDRKT